MKSDARLIGQLQAKAAEAEQAQTEALGVARFQTGVELEKSTETDALLVQTATELKTRMVASQQRRKLGRRVIDALFKPPKSVISQTSYLGSDYIHAIETPLIMAQTTDIPGDQIQTGWVFKLPDSAILTPQGLRRNYARSALHVYRSATSAQSQQTTQEPWYTLYLGEQSCMVSENAADDIEQEVDLQLRSAKWEALYMEADLDRHWENSDKWDDHTKFIKENPLPSPQAGEQAKLHCIGLINQALAEIVW